MSVTKSTKMTRTQLANFAAAKHDGNEVFNMMVEFYKKWKPGIAEELVEEDNHIFELTGHHRMHEILDYSHQRYYMLKQPSNLLWETIDGESTVYLKRKEADYMIHHFMNYCEPKCKWPDNYGITDVLDKFNKWLCHYNEI